MCDMGMNLEDIMLSEINQSFKEKYFFYFSFQFKKFIKAENKWRLSRAGEKKGGKYSVIQSI